MDPVQEKYGYVRISFSNIDAADLGTLVVVREPLSLLQKIKNFMLSVWNEILILLLIR